MLQEYKSFLEKRHKNNGDKLINSTIERYYYFIEAYEKDLLQCDEDLELIFYMNDKLKGRKSIVLYSAFKNYLMFLGHNPKDPDDNIRKLMTPEKSVNSWSSIRFLQEKVLSRSELKMIFDYSKDYMKMVLGILYDTACRKSEILKMKLGEVIFKDTSKQEDLKEMEEGIYGEISILGKGGKKRTVYLTKLTCDLIKKNCKGLDITEHIVRFRQKDGKLYKDQNRAVYDEINKLGDDVLGRHIHPHCFRHTKATHLCDSGADIFHVSRYLGHTKVTTTQIYVSISTYQGRMAFAGHSRGIA